MMVTYDDRTQGISESNGRFVLTSFKPCSDVMFKASYIVASDMKCNGKVTAFFDLIVFGNIEADELDIKGRLVCMGKCQVNGTVTVQNDIWVEDIRADLIETHDGIIAQRIDVKTIKADGSIVVGKILEIEGLAQTSKNILCGETAYGAGKIVANSIITGDPLDLDKGEEAISSPIAYNPINASSPTTSIKISDLIMRGIVEFAPMGNYKDYLDLLVAASAGNEAERLTQWKNVLTEAEKTVQSGISDYKNIVQLIWLAEIASSSYFKNWNRINNLFDVFKIHFKALAQNAKESVTCSIGNYNEWLRTLGILSNYGTSIEEDVYNMAFELVVSNLGLKAKFVLERLNEKGWAAHG